MAKYDVKDVFYLDTTLSLGTDFDAGKLRVELKVQAWQYIAFSSVGPILLVIDLLPRQRPQLSALVY